MPRRRGQGDVLVRVGNLYGLPVDLQRKIWDEVAKIYALPEIIIQSFYRRWRVVRTTFHRLEAYSERYFSLGNAALESQPCLGWANFFSVTKVERYNRYGGPVEGNIDLSKYYRTLLRLTPRWRANRQAAMERHYGILAAAPSQWL